MIARALRPGDVVLWPPSSDQWWVKESHPVDPDDSLDGQWRLVVEQLTGLPPDAVGPIFAVLDGQPEDEFPLVGWEEE